MNHFEVLELRVDFFLDSKDLKKAYHNKSKSFHPDFHAQSNLNEQNDNLEKSTLVTKAFEVLKSFDSRMNYILEIYNQVPEEGQNTLPMDFLMEMMDLNEEINELEFSEPVNKELVTELLKKIEDRMMEGLEEVRPKLLKFDPIHPEDGILKNARDYYLKNKYLLRIKNRLSTFATA
jgi:molecular chaperone HscB